MLDQTVTVGVDLGTTSAKAVAYDAQGAPLASAAAPIMTLHPTDQAAEQDPDEVATAVETALQDVAVQIAARGWRIAHLGLSAAMHSVIALDARDHPLTNALIWLDNRAGAVAQRLWDSPSGKALYARTGTPTHPMAPICKIIWLRETEPDLFARARRFVSLKEWLWRRWFGAWEVDASIASATGLYNLRSSQWDVEALRLAGITPDQVSAIFPTTASRAMPADHAPHPALAGAAITIGASDGCLANLAAHALDATTLALTIGTSCAVRAAVPQPITDPATRIFCYVLAEGRFIVGEPSNSGGVALEWAQQLMGHAANPTAFAQAIAAAAGAWDEHLLCLPYFGGERAPLWDPAATGTLHGLRLTHTPEHVLRAVIEGMLFNARWIAEATEAATGTPQRIVASGKALQTPWIAQLAADLFELPIQLDGASDASAKGAAQLALIASGALDWATRWGASDDQPSFRPRPAPDIQAKYRRFRDLCARLRA